MSGYKSSEIYKKQSFTPTKFSTAGFMKSFIEDYLKTFMIKRYYNEK